jgi:site-specific recombinase XerD
LHIKRIKKQKQHAKMNGLSQIWRIVKHIATKVELPAASTRWLRHAHATHSMDAGAPLRLIMAMGHADLRTPARYQYVRFNLALSASLTGSMED